MLLESKVPRASCSCLVYSRGSVPWVFLAFLVDFRRSKGFLALVLRSLVGLVGIKGSLVVVTGSKRFLVLALRFFVGEQRDSCFCQRIRFLFLLAALLALFDRVFTFVGLSSESSSSVVFSLVRFYPLEIPDSILAACKSGTDSSSESSSDEPSSGLSSSSGIEEASLTSSSSECIPAGEMRCL
jgi:hypothetical protein